ncbi:MAG: cob(I)yrinic acid a,c-diamide adenosyltransferase [Clostridium sp.]|nr:cob(I)yrinic acid a,c-diamide adenosyltransferase [Clostridium sp.]MCM1547095.1 cob(I)yrinic acid a,c-diamide adenosyltransferase [Ruminococcus sp.]
MGLIHIYCGNGKGKSTAAFGLALRAAGAGMRVSIIQLMKGRETSEINSLKLLSNVSIEKLPKDFGFSFSMSEAGKSEITECHNKLLKYACDLMKNHECDMLIIDEFFSAYNNLLLDRKLAESIIFNKEESCELILTGRDPLEKFIEAADYVSEITAVKHPFEKGVSARKGIEY